MRIQLLAALALKVSVLSLIAGSGVAHADVIEVSDSGEARVIGASVAPSRTPAPNPGFTGTRADSALAQKEGASDHAPDDLFAHAARRHGLDVNLLRAVAWTESRGRNEAVSPKGARGIMQLMPATAAALGVDARDPRDNINGGAAYLARQLASFQNVPLALAAYNAGPGAVMRYHGVPPFAETRDYVSRIMRRWSGSANTPATLGSPGDTVFTRRVSPARAAIALPVMLIEVPNP